jgi:hypothetical protein
MECPHCVLNTHDVICLTVIFDVSDLHNFLEAGPGSAPGGQLALYTPPGQDKAERFAWLRGDAIQQGRLALDLATAPDSDLDYLTERGLMDLRGGLPVRNERPPAMVRGVETRAKQSATILLFPSFVGQVVIGVENWFFAA